MRSEFPRTESYNRFTELMQSNTLPLAMFLKTCRMGKCTGKSTMGYFYGFKLHLVINDKGEVLSFVITPGNVDDRKPLKQESFLKDIFGKLFGDKGYISKQMADILFVDGVHLITQLRNNMKNSLMTLSDKIHLRKRSIIETVNDELKNICQVEHSRHRSIGNFFTNHFAGLIACSFFPKKPSIKYNVTKTNQLALF